MVGGRSEGADSPGMSALFEHLSERGLQVNQLLFFSFKTKAKVTFSFILFSGCADIQTNFGATSSLEKVLFAANIESRTF